MNDTAPRENPAAETPLARYQAALQANAFDADPQQRQAAEALEAIHGEIVNYPRKHGLSRLMNLNGSTGWPPVKGLYLWGPVGRGKTWLMDIFFETLPIEAKRRTHFHRFLQDLHARRRRQRHARDPLVKIADELATEIRVLCFDEFYVEDVGDAMILGRLFERLFEQGVTLVATSNTQPDELYAGGLQRERFLPTIELIKENTRVVRLDGGEDYRLRALSQARIYHYPLDEDAEPLMQKTFRRLADSPGENGEIEINRRAIPCRGQSKNVAWFDFDILCRGPRSADDYIELARCYHTLLISGVPRMTREDDNAARRFINLVDEAYDRGVKLIVTAQAPPEELYQGKRLLAPFERTQSRLIEMQSRQYLGRQHSTG
jgi:cell division protein ZapE